MVERSVQKLTTNTFQFVEYMLVYYLSNNRPLTFALSEQSVEYIPKLDLYSRGTPLTPLNTDFMTHHLSGLCVRAFVCVPGLVRSARKLIVWCLTARREPTG